ncbi:Methyltransferase domain-containing protein [Ferrimonas sediminum]|uniref:Methyltransferase domain-containing protein n=1 Tax=Ferrimonas sediminum TaxID=718193 RepID=A0A1G8UDZ8_9GAMM|nr:class I SAM-dependent methyltransferase [Ferrimonas sediminum]SDJ51952.1 Methyltransferase domain-containing protein [Ferrimonas sediminum]
MSTKFYNENAESFYADTVGVDMKELHQRFTNRLLAGARILDAGCGSGRDSLAFLKLGFEVEALDASEALVKKASVLTGLNVELKRFDEVTESSRYDGIWTCASLLHVPRAELPVSMKALASALKPGGIWYVSFKHGVLDRTKDGRQFTDLNETLLRALVAETGGLSMSEVWVTEDKRPERDDTWLNALLVKTSIEP